MSNELEINSSGEVVGHWGKFTEIIKDGKSSSWVFSHCELNVFARSLQQIPNAINKNTIFVFFLT